MVAAIPEAVEAASAAGGAGAAGAEGAGGARAAAKGPSRSGGRFRQPVALGPGQSRQQQGDGPRGGQRKQRQFSQKARKTGRGALKARLPGSHSYQPVILAEFLVAVILVAVSPLAKGGTPESQAKGSPSPYSTNTLKQLVAIGGVYFALALLASSRRAGRFAAWFGGLVLLGLGFTQLLSGDLQAIFGIFGPGSGKSAAQQMQQGAGLNLGNVPPLQEQPGAGLSLGNVPPLTTQQGPQGQQIQNVNLTGPGVIVSDTGSGQPGLA